MMVFTSPEHVGLDKVLLDHDVVRSIETKKEFERRREKWERGRRREQRRGIKQRGEIVVKIILFTKSV